MKIKKKFFLTHFVFVVDDFFRERKRKHYVDEEDYAEMGIRETTGCVFFFFLTNDEDGSYMSIHKACGQWIFLAGVR